MVAVVVGALLGGGCHTLVSFSSERSDAGAPAADSRLSDAPPDAALSLDQSEGDGEVVGDLGAGDGPLVSELPPEVAWSAAFGGGEADQGKAIASDARGNVYVAGTFERDVDFGDGVLPKLGGRDVYLASFTRDGVHRWSHRFGDHRWEQPVALATDAGRNQVYMSGLFWGDIDFGRKKHETKGANDLFFAAFDADDGKEVWSLTAGDQASDCGDGVAVDPRTGALFVTGEFRSTTTLGTTVLSANGSNDGDEDMFVGRLDPDSGAEVWAKRYGAADADEGQAVAVGPDGTVYAVGTFERTVDFGRGDAIAADDDSADAVVLALDPGSGATRWVRTGKNSGAGARLKVTTVAVDSLGNLYIGGGFYGRLDFGHGPLDSAGDSDIFLASYTSAGELRWQRRLGHLGFDRAEELTVDANGVYVAGSFVTLLDLTPTPLQAHGAAAEIYLLALDHSGNDLWALSWGGAGDDSAQGLALGLGGDLLLSGYFSGTVNFSDTPREAQGERSAFVLRLTR